MAEEKITVKCHGCGIFFEKKKSDTERRARHFHDRQCLGEFRSKYAGEYYLEPVDDKHGFKKLLSARWVK